MRGRNLALAATVLGVAALLSASVDERTLGAVADEQAMLETAVAMSETGDAGIARGLVFAVRRPNGEDVSPYGLGLPALLVPVCRLATGFERTHGAGSSQTLLAGLQILILAGVALAAGLLVRALGGSGFAERLAAAAAVLASPLLAYAGSLYSEPLQAFLLTAALALAVSGAARADVRRAAAAGLVAGLAVFVKPLNLAVAPFALAPLLLLAGGELRSRARLVLAVATGAGVTLGLWALSEVVRFGRPLSSYGDQRFTHPPLDGLGRLLAGPNKGLLLYFPLALLSFLGLARLARSRETRGGAIGIAGLLGSLLAISSAWWAWDGTVGWGPRLLLPALPALAAAAALATDAGRAARAAGLALVLAGLLVNALGALQPESAASAYLDSCGPVAPGERDARRLPPSFLERDAAGKLLASPSLTASEDAALSPLRTHLFLLRARLAGESRQEIADRIATPPWRAARPELVPKIPALSRAATRQGVLGNALTEPFSWPRLGRVLTLGEEERGLGVTPAWKSAMANQVYRNLDVGRPAEAERLARTLFEVQRSGFHAALVVESLRLSGRPAEAAAPLSELTPSAMASPALLLARALLARDLGDEAQARALIEQAARVVPAPAVLRARGQPPSRWPALHDLLIGK